MVTTPEVLFDAVKDRYDSELEYSSELDTKIGTVMGFVGAVLTIIILFVGSVLYPIMSSGNAPTADKLLPLTGSVILLIAATASGVYGYYGISYHSVPDPVPLLQQYKNEANPTKIIKVLAATMAAETQHNIKQNGRKVKVFGLTLELFAAGTILSGLFVVILINVRG